MLQVEANLSPMKGEDTHAEEMILGGQIYTSQHSEECVHCLRKVDRTVTRHGHSTRIILLILCSCCHELCLLQTMWHDSDHKQAEQHCYFADMAYETKCV